MRDWLKGILGARARAETGVEGLEGKPKGLEKVVFAVELTSI